MSRIPEYFDDYANYALDAGRFERNSRVVWSSKRGQKMLREIEAALVAMPAKRLVDDAFAVPVTLDAGDCTVTEVGDVCVLGAWGQYRGIPDAELLDFADEEPDAEETARWAETLGMANTMAYLLVDLNDEVYGHCSPEQRYEQMLASIRARLRP